MDFMSRCIIKVKIIDNPKWGQRINYYNNRGRVIPELVHLSIILLESAMLIRAFR